MLRWIYPTGNGIVFIVLVLLSGVLLSLLVLAILFIASVVLMELKATIPSRSRGRAIFLLLLILTLRARRFAG
jgi:hypothetical protein